MSDEKGKPDATTDSGDHLSLNVMKSLASNRKAEGSVSSNGGNNSDNSALVSLGNASFGFNFDSEGGSSAPNSDDSDGQGKSLAPKPLSAGSTTTAGETSASTNPSTLKTAVSSLTADSTTSGEAITQQAAANDAVAGLQTITNAYQEDESEQSRRTQRKRKSRNDSQSENGGYNSGSEGGHKTPSESAEDEGGEQGGKKSSKKKRGGGDQKREERNAREKERSFRISKQINELRDLLSTGGVLVPKGTKSSVLTEAANYIRLLQQHQYRSELDRHQLVQQMQMIGSGAHGPQAAAAIRHVAAQNGVWSLGNFGGVPPKSSMSFYQSGATPEGGETSSTADPNAATDIPEYRNVFNSCGIGMALASMGGAFIDANQLFCQLSSYSKQELCSLTIFNLTARQDLQHAFDLISQMISPPVDLQGSDGGPPKQVMLRGTMKERTDLGLSVSLIKGEDGIAKCFCVTLIQSPPSPFDTAKPVPVSFESILPDTPALPVATEAPKNQMSNAAPTFTSG